MNKRALLAAFTSSMLTLAALAGCGGMAGREGTVPPQAVEPAPSPEPAPAEQTAVPAKPAAMPVKGGTAPEVVATDVVTGEVVRLSSLRGQPVMLNFWATWCGPCRQEMPDMQTLQTEMDGRIRILAIGGDGKEAPGKLEAFGKSLGLTFTILHDGGEAARTYRILGLPTTFFVDSTGVLQARVTGAMSLEQMRSLAQSAIEAAKTAQP